MNREIEELLEAVADGVDVDWEAAAARSPQHRRVINNLRVVDNITKATAVFAAAEPDTPTSPRPDGLVVWHSPRPLRSRVRLRVARALSSTGVPASVMRVALRWLR